jgi:hypothetical protein
MTNIMMRRRLALTLSLGALAGCATPKPKIFGTQIPVLPETNGLVVAPDAPAVVVPAPVALTAWPQVLAGPAHAPGNIAAPGTMNPGWHVSIGEAGGFRQPLQASPLVAAGHVFTMDAGGAVAAFALADGSRARECAAQTCQRAKSRRRHRL